MQMKERAEYFDTLRLLTAFWVYTIHFIAFVDIGLFRYLDRMPLGLITRGLSGKLCVAVFSVILGYFAYQKGKSAGETTLRYAVRRYLYFAIAGFVVNSIYAVTAWAGLLDRSIRLPQVFLSAFWLRSDILESFWCMRPFLAGSILGFLAGRYRFGFAETILETMILILTGQIWIGLAMFGVLTALMTQQEKLQRQLEKKWVQLLIVVGIFILIHRSESNVTYLLDGVFAVGILLVTANNRGVRALLENRWITRINKNYMGFYLLHQLSYNTIGAYLLYTYLAVPFKLRFPAVYLLCLAVTLFLAEPLNRLICFLSRYAGKLLDKIMPTGIQGTVPEQHG